MTIAFPQAGDSPLARLYWQLIRLPWHAIKTYPPVFLLASGAAYASSQFAAQGDVFPPPFNWMQAVAFEWMYLGALALAGARRGRWFFATVVLGAGTSALYMFLHAATINGWLAAYTDQLSRFLLAAAHALPLTLVGISYMLLIHEHAVEVREETAAAKQAAATEAARLAAIVLCDYCGLPCANRQALWGHWRSCPAKPKK